MVQAGPSASVQASETRRFDRQDDWLPHVHYDGGRMNIEGSARFNYLLVLKSESIKLNASFLLKAGEAEVLTRYYSEKSHVLY